MTYINDIYVIYIYVCIYISFVFDLGLHPDQYLLLTVLSCDL